MERGDGRELMAVDAWIEFDCEPRRTLGSGELLRLVKLRGYVELIEDLARQQGARPEDVPVDLAGPDGEQVLDYGRLQGRTAPLRELASHCTGCPANLWAETYGCVTAIGYPIDAAAERWLLEHLPADLSVEPGLHLVRAIRDFNIEGARVRQMRAQGLLADPDGLARRFGSFTVTSDQALELLLFTRLQPAAARLFLLLYGAVEPVPRDQVQAALAGDVPLKQAVFLTESDSPSVRDLKRVFVSLLAAVQLGTVVRLAP